MVPVDEILELKGLKFPGGSMKVEHWENWLLTDCTGSAQLPSNIVHPIALFHIPIQGVGTSIAELFALGQVEGAGSVGLEGYDWEYFSPLHEDVEYRFEGQVIEVERVQSKSGGVFDRFVFTIELTTTEGDPVAKVTNSWRFWRSR